MAKLDNQHRITIPKSILEIAKTDFTQELRLYVYGKDFYIDNPSKLNRRICCLGVITLDSKGRLIIPKIARQVLNLKANDNITCFLLDDKITFRKVFFIPENR